MTRWDDLEPVWQRAFELAWEAYGRNTTQSNGGLFALPLFGDRKPITIADTPFGEDEPRFSKDGRWVAYNSDESGMPQVYLQSFPATDQKRQISTDGGVQPRWRRELG